MTIPSDQSTGLVITLEKEPTPEQIAEDAAVELVRTDAENAQSWIEGQQWNEGWRTIDVLYDSPRQFATFEGSTTQKATVNRFILCQHVNSLLPKFTEGLFYDDQFFITVPTPGADNNMVRARASIIREQLKEMKFEEEVGRGIFQLILHGTGIWKWGLRREEEVYYEYKREEAPLKATGPMGQDYTLDTDESFSFKEVEHKRWIIKPFFENKEIRSILVDPKLKVPDIRCAGFVIDKYYLNLAEVLDLKNNPDYNLPDEDTIKEWFEDPKESPAMMGNMDTQPGSPSIAGQGAPDWTDTSEDPYQDCVMVLERMDKHKIITTINNKKVIQNRPNTYGCTTYYSSNFYDRIRSFWGIGDGKIVGTDQRLQQGLENGGLALLQLLLDPPFVTNQDQFVLTQNTRLRKGGNIKVKGDVRTAISPLEMPKLPLGELFAFLQNSQAKAEAADGMDEPLTSGSTQGKGRVSMKSAGVVGSLGAANASRLMGPVGRFCNQVFIPWIYQLDSLNRRFIMTTPEGVRQFKRVLGERYPDLKFDPDGFMTGKVDFDVLAGAHLAAKKVMAQALPILTSILESPQLQAQLAKYAGKFLNVEELINMWLESTGWRNTRSLFKDLTPEMKAQEQAGEQQTKANQAMAMQQLKGQQNKELQDEKAKTGMARDAVKAALTSESNKQDIINQAEQQGAERMLRNADVNSPEVLGEQ